MLTQVVPNDIDSRGAEKAELFGDISRRQVLSTAAVVGVAGGGVTLVGAQESREIQLEGYTGGWEGVTPSDIEGQTNPTLSLEAGEDYTVTWTNKDGAPHNFALLDADENVIQSTEIISDGSQTVEFTASEEMAMYICEVHPSSMRGEIQTPTGTDTPEATDTPEQTETETSDEESNDDRAAAEPVTSGDPVNGTLSDGGDVDWYAIDATAGDGIIATLELREASTNHSVQIDLFDPAGNEIGHTQIDGMGGPHNVAGYSSIAARYQDRPAHIADVAETNGTYYVRVNRTQYEAAAPGDVKYTLGVETTELDQHDPNENRAQATQLTSGEPLDAVMVGYDQDTYAVNASAGDNVTVHVNTTRWGPFDFPVDLVVSHEEDGSQTVHYQEYALGGETEFTFTAEHDGTYYLTFVQGGINTNLLQTGAYTLTVETSSSDTVSPGDGSNC